MSGAQSVTFKLYAVNTGSSPLYTEAQTVSVANGVFNAQIGAVTPLTLAFDVPYWLEISIGATVLTPRQPLVASAYALRAKMADSATTATSAETLSSSALTQYGIISGLPGRANTVSTVDSTGDVGMYFTITLGADSLPVIAYFESTIRRLKVAKCVNAACSGTSILTTVTSAGDVGVSASPAIALGPDDLPVISYYYANQLKVAKCINTACTGTSTLSTVESGTNLGLHSSITIGTDGLPRIAYNAPNFGLSVAKCETPTCSLINAVTTVDTGNNVDAGKYNSMTIGADGLPVTSSYDTNTLRVAKCVNTDCSGSSTRTSVDGPSVVDVGRCTSITLGKDGFPVISYHDATAGDLKVAKCVNAACTGSAILTAVDSTGDVGQYTSITMGADGLPVISYYDATNGDLKVAKCATPSCNLNLRSR